MKYEEINCYERLQLKPRNEKPREEKHALKLTIVNQATFHLFPEDI